MNPVKRVAAWLMILPVSIALASCARRNPIVRNAGGTAGIILYNCTILDGTGDAPQQDGIIVIEGERIARVGSRIPLPNGDYAKIDLGGAYVLPGLINAHVHQAYNADNLRSWLLAGVTTVRDMSPFQPSTFLETRDEFNAGSRHSRIVSACPMITAPGGYGSCFVRSPEEAASTASKWIEAGSDLIKIAIEDDLQGRTWRPLPLAEVKSIVNAAHSKGVGVSVHLSHARNLPQAIEAGVDDIGHMVVEPLDDATIKRLVDAGIYWTPTLELWQGVSKMHGLDWDDIAIDNVGKFFKAGGKIALGTDFAGYTCPFDKGFPKTEASLMKKAGMSNGDIIVAATRNAAHVCGMESDLGTIEEGKLADLVVVRGNPLEDMAHLERPVMVLHNGSIVD